MRSRALVLGLLMAGATDASSECPVRVQASCSDPAGDSSRCTFLLQGSTPEAALQRVEIRFEPEPEPASYEVAPSVISIGPNAPASAVVTVHRSERNPGLVRLVGNATGGVAAECARIDLPLDFLLQDLRITVTGNGVYDESSKDPAPEAALKVGAVEPVDLTVCDDKGQPIRALVPLSLTIEGLDASAEVGVWDRKLAERDVVLIPARQASQRVFVRPLKPGLGRLQAEVKLDQSKRTLGRASLRLRAEHAIGSRVGVVLLGGVSYWVLTLLAHFAGGRKTLLLALARTLGACVLGFFVLPQLKAWGVNLHADPTQLGSQFLVGIALAGLGPEGLLTLFKKQVGHSPGTDDTP